MSSCCRRRFSSGIASFPRVRIFSPATNVIWMTGETRSITWEIAYIPPPPLPPTLNATLLRHNHSDFSLPIAQFVPTLNLAYNWKIPNTVPAGSDYYISLAPKRFYPGHPNIRVSRSYTFTIVPSLPPPSPGFISQMLRLTFLLISCLQQTRCNCSVHKEGPFGLVGKHDTSSGSLTKSHLLPTFPSTFKMSQLSTWDFHIHTPLSNNCRHPCRPRESLATNGLYRIVSVQAKATRSHLSPPTQIQ